MIEQHELHQVLRSYRTFLVLERGLMRVEVLFRGTTQRQGFKVVVVRGDRTGLAADRGIARDVVDAGNAPSTGTAVGFGGSVTCRCGVSRRAEVTT